MPSQTSSFNPHFRDMLGLLLKHRVEFLLIGGHAIAAHGFVRYTDDIDFLVRPTVDNAKRLWSALVEFGAPLENLTLDDFTMPTRVVQFGVVPHRIDFLMSLAGVDFEKAWSNRQLAEIEGMSVPVLSKADLIRNKREVDRPQDRADVARLEGKHGSSKSKNSKKQRPKKSI